MLPKEYLDLFIVGLLNLCVLAKRIKAFEARQTQSYFINLLAVSPEQTE